MATKKKRIGKKSKSTVSWFYWPEVFSTGFYLLILIAGLYAQAHM